MAPPSLAATARDAAHAEVTAAVSRHRRVQRTMAGVAALNAALFVPLVCERHEGGDAEVHSLTRAVESHTNSLSLRLSLQLSPPFPLPPTRLPRPHLQ